MTTTDTTALPLDQTFVLQDNTTGAFRPGRYDWDGAMAAADADGFVTVRRLDEALAEAGR